MLQVLGKVPNIILQGAQQADADVDATTSSASGLSASASFRAEGSTGSVEFERSEPASQDASGSAAPQIVLDDATLMSVSRAVMGRLDIVDLIGRNTAVEAAERVSGQSHGMGRSLGGEVLSDGVHVCLPVLMNHEIIHSRTITLSATHVVMPYPCHTCT